MRPKNMRFIGIDKRTIVDTVVIYTMHGELTEFVFDNCF